MRSLTITQYAITADGRAQMLAITDDGRVLVRVLAGALDETDQEFFGHLDPGTHALIVSTLREIVRRRGLPAVPVD